MDNDIAFCVPTYNHPATVDDILQRTVKLYDKYGIDIIYYDSSDTEATHDIVSRYQADGADNVYYLRFETDPVKKIYNILTGASLKKKYNYVIMIKDRSAFDEITIRRVRELADENIYDAIIMPIAHYPGDLYPQPDTEVYTDMAALFRDYAVLTTDWQTTLFRYDTLIKNMDIDTLKQSHNHEQVMVLFVGLARLDSPIVRVLRENEVYGYNSEFSTSTWRSQKYEVWGPYWSSTVDGLPDIYDAYKPYAKRQVGMLYDAFGSPYTFIKDAAEGILTREVAESLKDIWDDMTDIPYECLEYVFDNRHDLLTSRLFAQWKQLFAEQKYNQAYHMCFCNEWIKEVIGEAEYRDLDNCFEICKLELANHRSDSIFDGVRAYEDAILKYRTMAGLIRGLEKNGADKAVVEYFRDNRFTTECLAYIIENECTDTEAAIEAWEQSCEQYRE